MSPWLLKSVTCWFSSGRSLRELTLNYKWLIWKWYEKIFYTFYVASCLIRRFIGQKLMSFKVYCVKYKFFRYFPFIFRFTVVVILFCYIISYQRYLISYIFNTFYMTLLHFILRGNFLNSNFLMKISVF